jgi:hypothetical protein
MRTSPVVLALILSASLAAATAGTPITPNEAARHRGELVTFRGQVSDVQASGDTVTLTVGSEPGLAVTIPQAARPSFRTDPTQLRDHLVQITGFVSPPGQPLGLALESPTQLAIDPPAPVDYTPTIAERVHLLEAQISRLQAGTPLPAAYGADALGHVRHDAPIMPFATQMAVRAIRGIPTHIESTSQGRILYYGTEHYIFDRGGQLITIRHD